MKQLKGLPDFENAFRTISKHEQKIYNDLISKLTRSVKKLNKSWKKKGGTKSDNDFTAEYNRIGRFTEAYKNIIQFEINHFSDEHKKRYKEENWNFNLWCALVDYPWNDYQDFFSCELFWIWDDFTDHFKSISGMIAKGYINIDKIDYIN